MQDDSPHREPLNVKNDTTVSAFGLKHLARHVACGFLMGGADVIPGVSGGTVALVLGIYQRLVTAISHFDRQLWEFVKKKQWRLAANHIDLVFLISLGFGIGLGVISLGGLMNDLLTSADSRPYALSALFGLIAASAVVVGKLVARGAIQSRVLLLIVGIGGAIFASWLTQLTAGPVNTSVQYVFISGAVAICAMILPGISGAYLLLILGLYGHITGILKRLPRGQVEAADLVTLSVFALGCALGLILFSKLLRWLLQHYGSITMAVLCGFMIGALSKVWPFQKDLTPEALKLSHKHFENYMPELHGQFWICLAIAAVLFIGVLGLDTMARKPDHGEARRTA